MLLSLKVYSVLRHATQRKENGLMELGNSKLLLMFDDSTGSLAQITDVDALYQYLPDSKGNRLFRMTLTGPDRLTHAVCSHEAGRVEMVSDGGEMSIEFPDILLNGKSTGVAARVKVRLPEGAQEAIFSIEVTNNGTYTVDEVAFPWIGGWTGIAGKGEDKITMALEQSDPYALFPTMRAWSFGRANQRKSYGPTYHAVPIFDLSGGGRGISCNLYTSVPRLYGMYLENLSPDYKNLCLSWAWIGYPYLKSGRKWKSPDIGLGVHQGDWHDTADRLRESISKWWKAPQVTNRLRESIGYFNIQFRGHNKEHHHDFAELPAIAADCRKYGVEDLCVWDYESQTYVRYDRGRQFDYTAEELAELRRGVAGAREAGCTLAMYLDFWLTADGTDVHKEMADDLLLSEHGKPFPACIRFSTKHTGTLDASHEQGVIEICQRSDHYREYALDIVRRIMDIGFDSVFVDGGSAWNLCHADNHGHMSPDDTIEGAYIWHKEASRIVKERNPEGYLIAELPDRFNSQVFDLTTRWYAPQEPIEVFRYVLPDALLCYPIDENDLDLIAKAFARGNVLSLMTTDLEKLLSDCPELAVRVSRLAKLRKATAPYLAYGMFRDNRGLTIEGATGYVYTSQAGLAVAIANTTEDEASVKVQLSTKNFDKDISGNSILYLEDGSTPDIPLNYANGSVTMEMSLPPLEVAVWCIPAIMGSKAHELVSG